ncbi:MAG TPA: efflux RND transporter permease subunit [Anaerovoracaceae bacterium]|nr:efflux RND transporter permease subunit [Anaerovoracaceae bacterium]
MFLTDISLKRPVFAVVMIVTLLAVGITSFLDLNLNDMPETNIPYAMVEIILPGASPDQMESKVTKQVEEAVGQIAGAKHTTSYVGESYSVTMVEFDGSKASDDAAQDVRTKINSIRSALPQDIEEPIISKFDMNDAPVLSLALTGNMSQEELSDLVDDVVVPGINTVEGVGSVTVYGASEREIRIKADKDRLAALNITIDQVTGALAGDNIDVPTGKITGESREVTLRTYSGIRRVEDFRDIVITTVGGSEIRLGDVAEVTDGHKDQSSLSNFNGEQCIGIDVVKQSGTNTVKVTDDVKRKIEQMGSSLPEDVEIQVVSDNSESIRGSVDGVKETMIEGCALAVLIIFLFLRTLGSTVVSAISLPTSIITTFAAMKFMGFTLNMMTLMGLSLSVGLLVDDAIVVIENIVRHLRMGKTPLQAAKEATGEISLAVLATTLTIVAVFLPMAAMPGMMGTFFKEFGLTVAFAVMISLFVSFTLVPLMASRYVRDEENSEPKTWLGRFLAWFNRQFETLAVLYNRMLELALRHRVKTVLLASVIFLSSLTLVPLMGMNFLPPEDTGMINIDAELDSGLSLNAAGKKAAQIEEIIEKYPDVTSVYSTVQRDIINFHINLSDKKERKQSCDEIASQMRNEIKQIPGLDLTVTGSRSMNQGYGKRYSLHVQGNDFDQLVEYSQKAKQLLAEIPGTVDTGITYKAGKPETRITVDRDAAADLGVAPAAVAVALNTMFNGTTVGQYEDQGDRIDVTVSVEDSQGTGLDSVDGIYLTSRTTGAMVPIEQLTKKEYTTGSSKIERYDKSRDVQVQTNFIGISSSELSDTFMKKLNEELPPPEGIVINMGGDEQETQDTMADLIRVMVLGVLFIFLILAAQFESWIDPLAIMFSLPLAVIGAMMSLFITGSGLSVVGLIGIIFLMGLVTKNAILIIDFIKKRRAEGLERKEAILQAGLVRMRPIMMTTLAMILGMLPSALDSGTGAELRQPLAIAIVGGLISSTLLTLIVVPVIYTVLDDLKLKLKSGALLTKIALAFSKKTKTPA